MSTHETNGNGDNDQKWLDQVRLERLVAEPSTIVPFESSTVSWQVDAPAQADLRLGLNGTPVDTEGSIEMRPTLTEQFTLRARVGSRSKTLGTVTVLVDTASCMTSCISQLPELIVGAVEPQLLTKPNIYFESGRVPVVAWITDGLLHVKVHVKKEVHGVPDPAVDITMSFGLQVSDQQPLWPGGLGQRPITSTNETVGADISFPWYVEGTFGAVIQMLITQGKQEALQDGHEIIRSICEQLTALFRPLGRGLARQNVELYVDPIDGKGVFEVRFCPPYRPVPEQ